MEQPKESISSSSESTIDQLKEITFSERQRFSNWILWLILLSISVAAWFWFIGSVVLQTSSELAAGENLTPAWFIVLVWVILGVAVPVFVYMLRFDLKIENAEIKLQYFPFHMKPKVLQIKQIQNYKIVRFDALGDYGGWGVRKKKNTIGYITASGRGVIVLLEDNMQLTLGTDQPKDLYIAIDKIHKLLYPGKTRVSKNASISNVKKNLTDRIDSIKKK